MGEKLYKKMMEKGIVTRTGYVFRVGMLITCPFKYVLVDRSTSIMYGGEETHKLIQRMARENGWESEKPLEYCFENICIQGHPDLIHINKRKIVEIKNTRKREPLDTYKEQLRAYKWLARKIYGADFETYFLLVHDAPSEWNPKPLEEIREALSMIEKGFSGRIDYTSVSAIRYDTLGSTGYHLVETARQYRDIIESKMSLPRRVGIWCQSCPFKDTCMKYNYYVKLKKLL